MERDDDTGTGSAPAGETSTRADTSGDTCSGTSGASGCGRDVAALTPSPTWTVTDKRDQRPRLLADRHYTRQAPGHPMWTRPGYNQILYLAQANGRGAVFCWWRPKWESGIPGTERKDGLRCIECAIFRNETRFRSSKLIRAAVAAALTWEHANDVEWPDGLITGVNSDKTAGGRAPSSPPGHCFRKAGWLDFDHTKGRADVWLKAPLGQAVSR